MRWVNPVAWLGLLFVALPILIHLFSRRQTRVIPFPSLRFVAPSPLLPTRRKQLSDIALLMIRMAILALAVAALAGPLFYRNVAARDTRGESTTAVRAIVIDTGRGRGDSVSRHVVDSIVGQLVDASQGAMALPTTAPFLAIPGAVSWLQQQTGARELIILSDFRDGALDSSDLAMVPRNVTVQLRRVTLPIRVESVSQLNSVVWRTRTPSTLTNADVSADAIAVRDAVQQAVISRGGTALTTNPSRTVAARNAHEIVVSAVDSDSVRAWLSQSTALRTPWMGDALESLHRDTTLAVAMASVSGIADTAFAPPFVVISQSMELVPLVAAAAIPDSSNSASDRLLLVVRTSDDAVATAALLLAASNAVTVSRSNGLPAAIAIPSAAASDEQLRRWERAPSAPEEIGHRSASRDFATGPSDGRWLWVLVLALIGLETLVRRKSASPVEATESVSRG